MATLSDSADPDDLQELEQKASHPEGHAPASEQFGNYGDLSSGSLNNTGGTPPYDYKGRGELPENAGRFMPNTEWTLGDRFRDTPGESDSQRVRSFFQKHKVGLGIGGILASGSIGAIIFGSAFLLPLKIESIVQNIESKMGANINQAGTSMVDKMLDRYIAKYVLPGINSGRCTDTIHPGCVVVPNDSPNYVTRLYYAWKQNRIEYKLATDYGIVFGKENGQLYMASISQSLSDKKVLLGDSDLKRIMAGDEKFTEAVFEKTYLGSGKEGGRNLRQAFEDAIQGESKWKQVYLRLKYGKFFEERFGVHRCVLACKLTDNFAKKTDDFKKAAFLSFAQFVEGKDAEGRLQIISCLLEPKSDGCNLDLDVQPSGVKMSKYKQATIQLAIDFLNNVLEKISGKTLDEVLKVEGSLSKEIFDSGGIGKWLFFRIASKLVGKEAAQDLTDAIPVIGWINAIAQILQTAKTAGHALRVMSFAVNAMSAVTLFMQYQTVASEMKSGHIDATALGSFATALSSNTSGSSSDRVDATDTPLYNQLFGDGADPAKTNYRCNDGSRVPAGQLVCPEEKLDRGNGAADAISYIAHEIYDNTPPGTQQFIEVLQLPGNLIGNITGSLTEAACKAAAPCQSLMDLISKTIVSTLVPWLVSTLMDPPITDNMDGGRTFDMMVAGADYAYNDSCMEQMGCSKLPDQQIADIRNKQEAEDRAAFAAQPLFARLFSSSTPYSLVSRMALAIPASLPDAAAKAGTLIGNPFGTITRTVSDVFSGAKAFAATKPIADPFGITQYGYTADQIPNDPESYWNESCQGSAVQDWFNSQDADPNTGEPVATTPQRCLLIQSMVQAAGTIFDAGLSPDNSLNPDPSQ